jgi:hypothetical protein
MVIRDCGLWIVEWRLLGPVAKLAKNYMSCFSGKPLSKTGLFYSSSWLQDKQELKLYLFEVGKLQRKLCWC